ncbi:MAG: DUF1361 domain-containing protein [Candidatus Magasanikbacteria bacterium]|nr:DUF1361 domain-containing protein [Candidatus Magasanikbacteria bacterium]
MINPHTQILDILGQTDWANLMVNEYPVITIGWNIFLLSVPFFIAKILISLWRKTRFQKAKTKLLGLLLFCVWLLFAPNAAYIISDVRHISGFCPNNKYQICAENAWMIIFFFTYGIIGWVAHVYLINQMKHLVKKIAGKIGVFVYLLLISPLISLGLLLGLVNRWNSWDAFVYPGEVLSSAWLYVSDWTYFKNLLIYTIFLYILYFVGNIIFVDKIKLKK